MDGVSSAGHLGMAPLDVCDFFGDPFHDDYAASSNRIWNLCGLFFADSVRNVIFELNQLDLSMRRKKRLVA